MFNELAAIFDQDKNSADLVEISQPSISESPQPPSTAATSVVSSGTLPEEGADTSESRVAKIFQEESQMQMLRDLYKKKRFQEKGEIEGPVILALREENHKLHAELSRYKEALEHTICPHCGKSTTLGETPLSLSSSFPPLPSDFLISQPGVPISLNLVMFKMKM
ncbi:hypothetical protein M0R45_019462 [Rubus argutus]|uniref:Uncharacterized protein n=1 Tax=Rubus argutus TaxID=59490 RepID=A0AAW1X7X2_RUBAR